MSKKIKIIKSSPLGKDDIDYKSLYKSKNIVSYEIKDVDKWIGKFIDNLPTKISVKEKIIDIDHILFVSPPSLSLYIYVNDLKFYTQNLNKNDEKKLIDRNTAEKTLSEFIKNKLLIRAIVSDQISSFVKNNTIEPNEHFNIKFLNGFFLESDRWTLHNNSFSITGELNSIVTSSIDKTYNNRSDKKVERINSKAIDCYKENVKCTDKNVYEWIGTFIDNLPTKVKLYDPEAQIKYFTRNIENIVFEQFSGVSDNIQLYIHFQDGQMIFKDTEQKTKKYKIESKYTREQTEDLLAGLIREGDILISIKFVRNITPTTKFIEFIDGYLFTDNWDNHIPANLNDYIPILSSIININNASFKHLKKVESSKVNIPIPKNIRNIIINNTLWISGEQYIAYMSTDSDNIKFIIKSIQDTKILSAYIDIYCKNCFSSNDNKYDNKLNKYRIDVYNEYFKIHGVPKNYIVNDMYKYAVEKAIENYNQFNKNYSIFIDKLTPWIVSRVDKICRQSVLFFKYLSVDRPNFMKINYIIPKSDFKWKECNEIKAGYICNPLTGKNVKLGTEKGRIAIDDWRKLINNGISVPLHIGKLLGEKEKYPCTTYFIDNALHYLFMNYLHINTPPEVVFEILSRSFKCDNNDKFKERHTDLLMDECSDYRIYSDLSDGKENTCDKYKQNKKAYVKRKLVILKDDNKMIDDISVKLLNYMHSSVPIYNNDNLEDDEKEEDEKFIEENEEDYDMDKSDDGEQEVKVYYRDSKELGIFRIESVVPYITLEMVKFVLKNCNMIISKHSSYNDDNLYIKVDSIIKKYIDIYVHKYLDEKSSITMTPQAKNYIYKFIYSSIYNYILKNVYTIEQFESNLKIYSDNSIPTREENLKTMLNTILLYCKWLDIYTVTMNEVLFAAYMTYSDKFKDVVDIVDKLKPKKNEEELKIIKEFLQSKHLSMKNNKICEAIQQYSM